MYREDELYHHGVEGQHWGEKNGPPYPLDRKTHNAVVKGNNPAGRKKKKMKATSSSMTRTKKSRKEQKIKERTKMNRLKTEEKRSRQELKEAKKAAKRDAQYRDKLARAIESGSARKVAKYKSGMSDREIKRAIERINLENSLDSASNQQMLNKFAKFERLSNYARTTASMTTSAVSVYNNIAGSLNALKGTNYKLIRTSPPKNQNGSGSGGSGGGSP